jgi:hypothetical protein
MPEEPLYRLIACCMLQRVSQIDIEDDKAKSRL